MTLTPIHARLGDMAGDWEGRTTTWFGGDAPPDDSPWRVSIEPVVSGAFIYQSHEGHIGDRAFSGHVIYGYDAYRRVMTAVWVDSFHLGDAMLLSEGPIPGDPHEILNVVGAYVDRPSGQQWRWRTVVRMPDSSHLHIRAFNIAPDGREQPALETLLRRVV